MGAMVVAVEAALSSVKIISAVVIPQSDDSQQRNRNARTEVQPAQDSFFALCLLFVCVQ